MVMLCLNVFQRVKKKTNLNTHGSHSPRGCVLEVDLECPKELLDLNNNYPLAPQKNINQKRNFV